MVSVVLFGARNVPLHQQAEDPVGAFASLGPFPRFSNAAIPGRQLADQLVRACEMVILSAAEPKKRHTTDATCTHTLLMSIANARRHV
jgi:hypothetical protein